MRSTSTLRFCTLALAAVVLASGQMRYKAKIALEDGSPLPTSPQIIPVPSQRLMSGCRILTMFGDGTMEYIVNWRSRPYDPSTADMCDVTIRLKGYRTTQATLRNGGVIVLKRIGDNEGSTVSMTALKAPEPAQKAFGKGVAAMTDQKWAVAQKNFERAVEIYPDYAAAWSDLGEVFLQQSNAKEARVAWERAVQADPAYVKPYVQLARLALQERRMEDAVNIAERAFALNPVEFPAIYFFSAAANYNLKRMDASEKSARRAIELDTNHEIPRAQLLLGSVLAAKGDRDGALKHMRKYLEISPNATDAAEVNGMIAKIESTPEKAK
jgi:tetratricopeptide (TPR) repeat protein